MRTETINVLTAYAREHPDVMLLTADLGYSVLEQFAEALPKQYVNTGVCEQAMAGIAAGLALSGRRVVFYSIANFPTLRCLEQLRNNVCHHNLPVTVIAVGGGLAYGAQGYTHHGVEDLGIMAMLPNMTVACPADPHEAMALLPQLLERGRPGYLRLGRSGEPQLHDAGAEIALGRAIWLRRGTDIALLATGPILGRALRAADALALRGISASVASIHTVSPLDASAVIEAASHHRAVLTIEEHLVEGGFGSRVADALMMAGLAPRFGKFGVTQALRGRIGSQTWLLDTLGSVEDHAQGLM
jgi:transketolase